MECFCNLFQSALEDEESDKEGDGIEEAMGLTVDEDEEDDPDYAPPQAKKKKMRRNPYYCAPDVAGPSAPAAAAPPGTASAPQDPYEKHQELLDRVTDPGADVVPLLTFSHEMDSLVLMRASGEREKGRFGHANPYGSERNSSSVFHGAANRRSPEVLVFPVRLDPASLPRRFLIGGPPFHASSRTAPAVRRGHERSEDQPAWFGYGLLPWRVSTVRFRTGDGAFRLEITEVLEGPGAGLLGVLYTGRRPTEEERARTRTHRRIPRP